MAMSRDIEWMPSRAHTIAFEAKAWILRMRRMAVDALRGRPPLHAPMSALRDAPVCAAFSGNLWPRDEADPALVAGKLQNLRLAARRLHGIEPGAGQVLSFWRQVGRATGRHGYAIGRELREGCLVPALGGGLCQLTNAIHDCAVRAGLVVVERHRHSRVLPGSLAEQDRDATVFWNYLDLRLVAPFAWRLEVELDADALHVRIRARLPVDAPVPIAMQPRVAVTPPGDCGSCGEDACHRHVGPRAFAARRAWLVDEDWPEFRARRALEPDGLRAIACAQGDRGARLAVLEARIARRWSLWRGRPLPQARLRGLELLARAIARQLHPGDLDLVVPQGLLPWLWQEGVLGGRTFDVLMTALPMTALQAQLDVAHRMHPQSTTLGDFRAPSALIEAERDALARARRWITPHAGIARLAGDRAELLAWQLPDAPHIPVIAPDARPAVLLPASSLARKGVFELRDALAGRAVRVLLPPGAWEAADVWDGHGVERVASIPDGVARCDVAVLPAWIEHQPRGLLLALAAGKPVIATAACGLHDGMGWHAVAEGDVTGLRDAIDAALAR